MTGEKEMTTVEEIEQIRIMRYVQKLSYREISERVKRSRNTIKKIIKSDAKELKYERKKIYAPVREKIEDIIREQLEKDRNNKRKYQCSATRMHDLIINEHKIKCGYRTVARLVKKLRAELKLKSQEAFIPLCFQAGDAYQFDWGDIEVIYQGSNRKVYFAALQLCHSRVFYVRAYFSQKQELLLDAHNRAFQYFNGCCTRGIYDNMKTAVKRMLKGNHRNLQKRFAKFCSHYLIEPEFCNPARGNEKGRVENLIGTIKRNFFIPMLRVDSLEELNSRLESFMNSSNRGRKHPEFTDESRYDIYEKEKPYLVSLPPYIFESCRVSECQVYPSCYIIFEKNKYSVPSEYVGNTVTAKGFSDEVVVSIEGKEIARHKRSYLSGEFIFSPYHYLDVLAIKPRAFKDGLPFKNWKLPSIFHIYRAELKKKYEHPDGYFARTLLLLKDWSLESVGMAIKTTMGKGLLGDSYVLMSLKNKLSENQDGESISVNAKLAKYKADQFPASTYDKLLRRSEFVKEWDV
jgi:transposase